LFETHKSGEGPALAKDMRSRHVVSHAIDPGAQGTAGIEALEASPQLKVNLLEQIATFVRVSFVGAREAFERSREFPGRVPIHFVLASVSNRDGLNSLHIQR
jgi:hypothetical protein